MIRKEGDRVWASYGETINTGNFSSVKIDMGMCFELDDKDDPIEVIREIYDSVKSEVTNKKLNVLKERRCDEKT